MSDFDQYLEHFPIGLKVSVGIPVPGSKIFNDWAIIQSIEEDLLSLQLSRDVLPVGVKLTVGKVLDIRVGDEVSGYSCRAIIVLEGYHHVVQLRLIGEIVSSELREFYRIDAFLPIKYVISDETREVKHKQAWLQKRTARIAADRERKLLSQKPWQRLQSPPEEGEIPAEDLGEEGLWEDTGEGIDQWEQQLPDTRDHSWDDVVPLAANISGGGVRMLLHHQFEVDTLVPLEIYLPLEPEPRVIDVVGEVASVTENFAAGKQFNRTTYNTGIRFKFVDERDQDAIVSYISNVQLKRIRLMREQYLFRNDETPPSFEPSSNRMQRILRTTVIIIGAIVTLVYLIIYFKRYTENRPKNQIEIIFDKGYGEFLQKRGRTPAPGQ